MKTLVEILDIVVRPIVLGLVPCTVWRQLSWGSGSSKLLICVSFVVIVLAIISSSAYIGLVGESSSLTQGIFLIVLLAMVGLVSLSWTGKPESRNGIAQRVIRELPP